MVESIKLRASPILFFFSSLVKLVSFSTIFLAFANVSFAFLKTVSTSSFAAFLSPSKNWTYSFLIREYDGWLLVVAINKVNACLWPPERSPTFWYNLSSRPKPNVSKSFLNSSTSFLLYDQRNKERLFPLP